MRCYTFSEGRVRKGLGLVRDERFGQIVFLGESGRGRTFERLSLDRRFPAEVEEGRVLEASPRKIEPREGSEKKFRPFWVLQKPRRETDAVLVRVNTAGIYTRNCAGYWRVHAGQPETLVEGEGRHGDAGRLAGWKDSLVKMTAGDVLKIKIEGGSKTGTYALWIEDKGEPQTAPWRDFENLQAVAKAEEAASKPGALNLAFGQMKAFTYTGLDKVETGIKVSDGATGKVVSLGENGRGRALVEVPLVAFEANELVTEAAVSILSEEDIKPRWSHEQPTVKRIYGLTTGSADRETAVLVRLRLPHACRTFGEVKVLRGEPTCLAKGMRAGGAAGRADWAEDSLWVLRSGEALLVDEVGRYGFRQVVSNISDNIQLEGWDKWEIADAKANPAPYVEKGKAPWGRVPSEWIGRVVQVVQRVKEYDSRRRETYYEMRETHEGEIISIKPFVVNLGWDGRDRKDVTVECGVWVKLLPNKAVRRLEGNELQKREEAKTEAERLRTEAKALLEQPHFSCLDESLRERVSRVAKSQDSWGSSSYEFGLMGTQEILSWCRRASGAMAEAHEAEAEARETHERQARGEILINFEAWHRRGGKSDNGDGWIVRPDGSLRERDSDDVCRYKSDGNYRWNLVTEDELALKWSCGTRRDISGSSDFTVAKMPVSGLTEAQREAVRRIELEDIGTTENSFGLDPEAAERQAKMMAEAAQAFAACPACGEQIVYDERSYRALTGEYGMFICQGDHRISGLVDWNKPFDQSTEGRDAQVVSSKRVSIGMIEVLAYEKWGGWNINLRLRKLTEEELAEQEEEKTAAEKPQGSFSESGKRHFLCSCGCMERVTKADWRNYQQGQEIQITCPGCGFSTAVKK